MHINIKFKYYKNLTKIPAIEIASQLLTPLHINQLSDGRSEVFVVVYLACQSCCYIVFQYQSWQIDGDDGGFLSTYFQVSLLPSKLTTSCSKLVFNKQHRRPTDFSIQSNRPTTTISQTDHPSRTYLFKKQLTVSE